MTTQLPLTLHHHNDSIIAWDGEKPIRHAQFISHVYQIAQQLKNKPYVINLIENRYLFIVSLAASLLRQQTSLLPQTRAIDNIRHIQQDYPECYYLSTSKLEYEGIEHCPLAPLEETIKHEPMPKISSEHLAIITFTSGSTGTPTAHKKYWGDLLTATDLAAQRFGLYDKTYTIIATVPPQHMYGLETSVLFPILTGNAVYGGTPFYPEDIKQILDQLKGPTLLVTSPVHLKACVNADIDWKNIAFIISATATLNKTLAQQAQTRMHAKINEIFGCTEAGSIASRLTIETDIWTMYSHMKLVDNNRHIEIKADHLRDTTVLNDNIKLISDDQFIHLGRSNDMVNIAGKRESLANLTLKLQELENVKDGTFFIPYSNTDNDNSNALRLSAFVIAPDKTEKEIIDQLAQKMDPVFLPRPLYKVEQLPYNDTGKLTLSSLRTLYQEVRRKNVINSH